MLRSGGVRDDEEGGGGASGQQVHRARLLHPFEQRLEEGAAKQVLDVVGLRVRDGRILQTRCCRAECSRGEPNRRTGGSQVGYSARYLGRSRGTGERLRASPCAAAVRTDLPPHNLPSCVSQPGLDHVAPAPTESMFFSNSCSSTSASCSAARREAGLAMPVAWGLDAGQAKLDKVPSRKPRQVRFRTAYARLHADCAPCRSAEHGKMPG